MSATSTGDIESLRSAFNGEIFTPGHDRYDEERVLFNATHDKHPAVIAKCIGTGDVVLAVRFAREAGLEIAVKGKGRHPTGFASSEGGLVVDLSEMRGVKVDRSEQTAWVQGGADGGDVQAETLEYGLGAVTGCACTTGIGGVNLHGGVGWLSSKMGWGSDTILELELVTADGDVLRVAPDEHPDLFWAMRGAGSNFGVVTWMKLQLCPVPDQFLAGTMVWDAEQAPEVLRALRDLHVRGSDDLFFMSTFSFAPADPDMPEELHDKLVLSTIFSHSGDMADGEEELRSLREQHPAAMDDLGPRELLEFMREQDGHYPPVRQWYDDEQVTDLSEEVIDVMMEQAAPLAEGGLDPMSYLIAWPYRGALSREPEHPDSFRSTTGGWSVTTALFWENPDDDEKHAAYSDAAMAAVRDAGLASGVVYANVMQLQDEQRLRKSFGEEDWNRLAAVKAEYDPDNVFHLNHNIPPAA